MYILHDIYMHIYNEYIHTQHTYIYTHVIHIQWNINVLKLKKKFSAICNKDEPEGHYAKWNKPNTEGQIF